MNDPRTAAAVDELLGARHRRERLAALSEGAAPRDQDEAYRIQAASLPGILEQGGGGRAVGHKIGCTNVTAQQQLGLDAPFRGRLLEPTVYDSGARVPADLFFMRQMEVEFAFRIARDLPAEGAPFERADLEAVTGAVLPGLEIVDSRYRDWTTIGALALIADNAANGGWVGGEEIPVADWTALDLAAHETALVINGEVRDVGRGGNVLGHPFNVLVWLADRLARDGLSLRAGDIVTTGTTTLVLPAERGDRVIGDFGALGRVEVVFE